MPPARDGEFVDEDACEEAAGRDEGAVDLGRSQGGVGRHQLRPQPQQQLSVQPEDACNIGFCVCVCVCVFFFFFFFWGGGVFFMYFMSS